MMNLNKNHYDTLHTQRKRTVTSLRSSLPAAVLGRLTRFRTAEPYNRLSPGQLVNGQLSDFHVAIFHWYRWNIDVRCIYCGVGLESGKNLTKDHVHPRSKGGPTSQGNLEPACQPCNGTKADKKLLVFLFENKARRGSMLN